MTAHTNINVEDNFEDWCARVTRTTDNNNSWTRIGEWAFPSHQNGRFTAVFFHLCEKAWELSYNGNGSGSGLGLGAMDLEEDKCHVCYKPVPDGIKMIALLEKL